MGFQRHHPEHDRQVPQPEALRDVAMDAAAQAPDLRAVDSTCLLGAGDVADVHLAREPDGPPRVVKLARGPEGNALLDNERRVLARLWAAADGTTYRRYLPTLAGSSSVAARRVNVFLHEAGFHTLEQVRERHPALDGRHLGWVFNRLLTALGFCHAHGVLHGAVLPCHVLLHPEGHGLRLVGWGQSVADGQPISALSARHLDWYPPEVRKQRPASPATDLFLAARCLVYLAGGDPVLGRMPDAVPEPMRRFVGTCLLSGQRMRPTDAWRLQEEFGELLGRRYGPPRFHEFKM